MKTLVLVDGSPCSETALEYVITHQELFQSSGELHVLHVIPSVPYGTARDFVGAEAINSYYDSESSVALASARKVLTDKGVAHQSGYRVGDIGEQVNAYASKHEIEMIVMGSHGRGVLRNLVLGSIATRVLATSHIPVLIVR